MRVDFEVLYALSDIAHIKLLQKFKFHAYMEEPPTTNLKIPVPSSRKERGSGIETSSFKAAIKTRGDHYYIRFTDTRDWWF